MVGGFRGRVRRRCVVRGDRLLHRTTEYAYVSRVLAPSGIRDTL